MNRSRFRSTNTENEDDDLAGETLAAAMDVEDRLQQLEVDAVVADEEPIGAAVAAGKFPKVPVKEEAPQSRRSSRNYRSKFVYYAVIDFE